MPPTSSEVGVEVSTTEVADFIEVVIGISRTLCGVTVEAVVTRIPLHQLLIGGSLINLTLGETLHLMIKKVINFDYVLL